MQYRCAGFVQAEIERYAEEMAAPAPEEPVSSDEEDEEDEEQAEPEEQVKTKKGRGKKAVKASSPGQPPQSIHPDVELTELQSLSPSLALN